MNSYYFTANIGSCLIILLIALDYIRKYNTDTFQRKVFLIMLCSVFFAAVFDYFGRITETKPGESVHNALYFIWSGYFIARNCCFYYAAIFVDYFTHGNARRTKIFEKTFLIFIIMYVISLLIGIVPGYYFYISRDNIYVPGTLYVMQILISFFPIIIMLVDISLAPKYLKRPQIFLTIVFVILSAIGASLDVFLGTTTLVWPCISAAILYVYFFILRSDSKIDCLTGIGNRSSFNEYINNLANQISEKEHMFVKFNLDRFREINDRLGHTNGDHALQDIALIIKKCAKNADFAARLGGDEFILVSADLSQSKAVIDRINEAIDDQNKKCVRLYQLYLSYGYDVYKGKAGRQIQEFLAHVDIEMNKYKTSRREKVSCVITADLINKISDNGGGNV